MTYVSEQRKKGRKIQTSFKKINNILKKAFERIFLSWK